MSRRAARMLASAVALTACAAPDTPEAQVARGAVAYAQHCQGCHDVTGAIGVALTGGVIGSYGTADRLWSYLRVAMPYGTPGSLDAQAYRDIVAYLASNRGSRAVPLIGDSATAAQVSLLGPLPDP